MEAEELQVLLKNEGVRLSCTVPCASSPGAEARYMRWLEERKYGSMEFLRAHGRLKYRPGELQEGCKSILLVAVPYPSGRHFEGPYFTGGEGKPDAPAGRVADYAVGRDYHKTVKALLKRIVFALRSVFPGEEFRPFVDSGPLDERFFAAGGLGFIGRNRLLISHRYGSRFFIGEVLSTAELPLYPASTAFDRLGEGFDGGQGEALDESNIRDFDVNIDPAVAAAPGGLCPEACRACIEACPTAALTPEGEYLLGRCISYLTIEHEGEIGEDFVASMGDRIFGCDSCQDVCPFNKGGAVRAAEEAPQDFSRPIAGKWLPLQQVRALEGREQMVGWLGGSPLMRCSLAQLKRNAEFVARSVKGDGR